MKRAQHSNDRETIGPEKAYIETAFKIQNGDELMKQRTVLAVAAVIIALAAVGWYAYLMYSPKPPKEFLFYAQTLQGPIIERVAGPIMLQRFNTKIIYEDLLVSEQYSKLLAQKDKPQVSVVTTTDVEFQMGKAAGLWEKLDPNIVTNIKDLFPLARTEPYGEYSVGFAVWTVVIQYNTKVFQEKGFQPPKGYADLFRPEFAGKVGLTSTTSTVGIVNLVMLARMNGGSERNIDPGFALAKKLRPSIHSFPTKSSVVNDLFTKGELWISTQYCEGAYDFASKGAAIGIVYPEEGVPYGVLTIQVVKNAPHQREAQEFVNLMLSPEVQAALATERWVIPTNSKTKLPTTHSSVMPHTTEQFAKLAMMDWLYVSEHKNEWHERWIKEIEAGAS